MPAKFVYSIIFAFLVLGIGLIVLINRKNSVQQQKALWLKLYVYILLVLLISTSLLYNIGVLFIAFVILLLGFYEVLIISKSVKPIIALLGITVYGLLCFAFLQFILNIPNWQKLYVYILILIFDGFSQLSGQLLGKHRPFPKISPNKTSEGILGGFFALFAMAVLLNLWLQLSYPSLFSFAFSVGIASLCGDLLASFYKRICKVKDYSQFIPGHGGVLDRFDSFIFAGSVYWLTH